MGVGVSRIPYRVPSAEGAGNSALIRPPVCIADSCAPGGRASPTRVPCKGDTDCVNSAKCLNRACWIKLPYSAGAYCTSDAECWALANMNVGVGSARCILDNEGKKGQCAYKDVARELAFHVCDSDAECVSGTCDTANKDPLTNQAYCSGGCACGPAFRQKADTTTPLGYVCKATSACSSNPCNAQWDNGNTCTSQGADAYSCVCDANWTGPNCMSRKTGEYGWPCVSDTDCKASLQCRRAIGNLNDARVCGPPVFEENNMTRFPYSRCPGGLSGSGLAAPYCILVGSAPTCGGNTLAMCRGLDPKEGGDPGMELVGVTERTGFGFKACTAGFFKGLCAPKTCETDDECGTPTRMCCPTGPHKNTCMKKPGPNVPQNQQC